MSSRGADGAGEIRVDELEELGAAQDRAIQEILAMRRRVRDAEERADRSDELLREFVGGTQDPAALSRRLSELEKENEALRARIERGKQGVDQVLTKMRFLEDAR